MELHASDVFTTIHGFYPTGLLDEVTSYRVESPWFSPAYRKGNWDGRRRFVKYDKQTKRRYFPTGFLPRVTEYLDKIGHGYSLFDERRIEPIENVCVELLDNELGTIRLDTGKYAYQGQALEAALLHGRGVIHAAVNAGKTEIGAAIIKSIGKRTVWFTHRTNLLYQTQKRLSERLGVKVGIVGDGVCQYEEVTACTIQTCATRQHDDFLKTVEVVVGDELHHLGGSGDSWFNDFAACPAPYRFGLSATPEFQGAGMKLLAMTGPAVFRITSEELIKRGVSVPPRIWIVEVPGPKIKSKNWKTVYSEGVVNNQTRHEKTCEVVRKFRDEGKPTLILVSRIKHGELLRETFARQGIRSGFIRGAVSQEEREKILGDLWAGHCDAVVAVASTMGEGVNLPRLRAIVNATGLQGGGNAEEGETGRDTIQILGRGLRSFPGKDYVDYVDFADLCHKSLSDASNARLGTLLSEGFGKYVRRWESYGQ